MTVEGSDTIGALDRAEGKTEFDSLDLEELLEVIGDLIGWLRVGTFDEEDGERDAFERAHRLLLRYGKAT